MRITVSRPLRIPGGTIEEKMKYLERLAASNAAALVGLLPEALADRSPSVRAKTVLLVTDQELKEALPLVEQLLHDPNAEVRFRVSECIGVLKDGQCLGLRALLSDVSPVVRAQAAESLALTGDRGALPKLARLLSDKEPFVRSYAAVSIGELKGHDYLERIRRVLRKECKDLARIGMLEALFRLGQRGVFSELTDLLESPAYHVRCSVASSLESMPLDDGEVRVAMGLLSKASRKALGVADESTVRRVLRTMRSQLRPA